MWTKLYFISFLVMTSCFAEYRYNLSICMIFRDEALYLKEWIEFHRLVGVEHFYLCSHHSQDHFKKVLKPYIKKGIVDLKILVDDPDDFGSQIQMNFYNECINKFKNESKWIAVLDADEFLFPAQEQSLIPILKEYEEFGGIAVNWQMFGTSHIEKLQSNVLMIEQLLCCAPRDLEVNTHIKSIIQPQRVAHFGNPHSATYLHGYAQVNTQRIPFIGPFSPSILVNQLRINHYWTRDEDYFWNCKVPRQYQFWKRSPEETKKMADPYNDEIDLSIQRFVPELRRKMRLD
jgi:hypothetical protein